MKASGKVAFLVAVVLGMPVWHGCVSSDGVERREDSIAVNELNFKDWRATAAKCVKSLLSSPAMGGNWERKPVIMIRPIENATNRHVNPLLVARDVRIAILRSGKAITTTASTMDAAGGSDGISPDFVLEGEVVSREDGGNVADNPVFMLHFTLIKRGANQLVWEESVEVGR